MDPSTHLSESKAKLLRLPIDARDLLGWIQTMNYNIALYCRQSGYPTLLNPNFSLGESCLKQGWHLAPMTLDRYHSSVSPATSNLPAQQEWLYQLPRPTAT